MGEDGARRADRRRRSRPAAATRRSTSTLAPVPIAELLRGRRRRRSCVPAADKLALLRAADKAARAYDPRIVKVEASFAEAIKRGAAVHVATAAWRTTSSR